LITAIENAAGGILLTENRNWIVEVFFEGDLMQLHLRHLQNRES
jgi:hypothetical protein